MAILAIAVIVGAIRRPGSPFLFRVATAYGVVSLAGGLFTAPLSELAGAVRGAHFVAHLVFAMFQVPLLVYTLGVHPRSP